MKILFLAIVAFFLYAPVFSQDISELVFQGNKKTRSSFIAKMVSIEKGTRLDSIVLEEDIIRLKKLPGFTHAYYQVQSQSDGNYKVVYGFEENFTIIPSFNVYTTNQDEFAFRAGLYEFNGLGRNIGFGGFYQYDIFNSYAINFRAPYLFGRNLGLAVNYQDLTTLEPVFLSEGTANYRYNNRSFEVIGLFQLTDSHSFELGMNYFVEDYQYRDGATNNNVPLTLNVHKLLYKTAYHYNAIDFYYQYLDGFKNRFSFQYVTSRSADLPEFIIAINDLSYYKRIGTKGNWASRLRLGIASNDETPFAPFAVDNNLNIRGVGNTIDRGTGAIVLNTEYRHTMFDKKWFALQGNGFIDAGSWRNPGGDFSDFGKSENLRVYPGIGLRFIHKYIFNAIFRIDFGFGITKDSTSGLVFGIGQYF